jgi:hypothetical protein
MALAPLVLTLAAVLAAGPAPVQTTPPSPEVRDRVRALLGAIHEPVPPETFRALGPGVDEALAEFALEAAGPPTRRARALETLAALNAPAAEAVHREVAASATAPRSVRRTAVRGLGRLAGPQRAEQELTPYLERDRDPLVRAAAAEALAANAPGPSACGRIRAQAQASTGSRYARALDLCDRGAQTEPR